ncbi:MAG: CAP domain-containing protein [Candidatus Gracilibacteria bacterium]|nr:CAP domain-containing protein [Candidatus Gracilibacteria bacterium]
MKKLLSSLDEKLNPWSKINQIRDRFGPTTLKAKAMDWMRKLGVQAWDGAMEMIGLTSLQQTEKKIDQYNPDTKVPEKQSEEDFPVVDLENSALAKEFITDAKTHLIKLFGSYRRTLKSTLPQLEYSEDLCTSARKELKTNIQSSTWRAQHNHSQNIHDGEIGEITTSGFETLEQALENFLKSPLHRWFLQRNFTKMGFAALQGKDGRWFLNVHFSGAKAENPSEELKAEKKRELNENEQEFMKQSKEKLDETWKKKTLPELTEKNQEFLETNKIENNRTTWILANFEKMQEKHEGMEMVLEKIAKSPSGEKEVVLSISRGDEKYYYVVNPNHNKAVITDESMKVQQKDETETVALDLIFRHAMDRSAETVE